LTWLTASGVGCTPPPSCPGRTIAITHPAVIRAALIIALDARPESFWRIDVPPLTATTLHARTRGWTLRHACLPLGR